MVLGGVNLKVVHHLLGCTVGKTVDDAVAAIQLLDGITNLQLIHAGFTLALNLDYGVPRETIASISL